MAKILIVDDNKQITSILEEYAKKEGFVPQIARDGAEALREFEKFQPDMLCVVRRKRGFFKKMWEKNEIHKREFNTNKPLLVLPVQD